MNKENAKLYLRAMGQALADGKTLQFLAPDGRWVDLGVVDFLHESKRFRIKPEPREFWIVLCPANLSRGILTVNPSATERDRLVFVYGKGTSIVHVMEKPDGEW